MRIAKLNRTISHRRAMFRNLVSALIEHEQIKTTFPKAKAIARLAERVITWSKNGSENIFYQRKAESYLMNWVQVRKHLFQNLAKRYETREGGYTRIHRVGFRANDHAPLAVIELVDNARDLKRDKVIRTISRELAQLELSQKSTTPKTESSSTGIKSKIPAEVWRNVPCRSEVQAKQIIDECKRLLPEMTKKNLKKVLSEQYVNAYQYCQPPQIPTREEATIEATEAKRLRRELLRKAADDINDPSTNLSDDSSRSSLVSLPNNTTPRQGLKSETWLMNLALLDPNKLAGRLNKGFPKPRSKTNTDDYNILDQIPSFENA
ncbi:hypothetical protein KEM48_008686 [Puccinia striiformis f. sp. tritici PST-130]|nr:hypothetical protein KEM48_008686 [Puccinia striiformis f. sp. tritici PST-130]